MNIFDRFYIKTIRMNPDTDVINMTSDEFYWIRLDTRCNMSFIYIDIDVCTFNGIKVNVIYD